MPKGLCCPCKRRSPAQQAGDARRLQAHAPLADAEDGGDSSSSENDAELFLEVEAPDPDRPVEVLPHADSSDEEQPLEVKLGHADRSDEEQPLEVTCQNGHLLKRDTLPTSWICNQCFADTAFTRLDLFRCGICNFNLCSYCHAKREASLPAAESPSAALALASEAASGSGDKSGREGDDPPASSSLLPSAAAQELQDQAVNEGLTVSHHDSDKELLAAWEHIAAGRSLASHICRHCYEAAASLCIQEDMLENTSVSCCVLARYLCRHYYREASCQLNGAFEVQLRSSAVARKASPGRQCPEFEPEFEPVCYAHREAAAEQMEDLSRSRPELGPDEESQRRWFAWWDIDGSGTLSQMELREAMEDAYPQQASSVRLWLAEEWPHSVWSVSGEEFVTSGLGTALFNWRPSPPCLTRGGMLVSLAWFDFFDKDKDGRLSKQETIEALVQDPLWRWGRAAAEDVLEILWSSVDVDKSGYVEKREFVLAGGLAECLKQLLSSDLPSVDDWIMLNRHHDWEGQECGICLCSIDWGETARRFRCGCWLHLECAGRALELRITERKVDHETMSSCLASCGRPLGRPIPPGVVRAAVIAAGGEKHGDGLFRRYLDACMEIQWKKEAEESGLLVAECPRCRFLVVCNVQAEMMSVKCLRPDCSMDRFCALCGDAPHRPLTCAQYKRKQKSKADAEKELSDILDLGYQRCPNCGAACELAAGCKYLLCNCGTTFCYHCGRYLPYATQHYHHWQRHEGPFGDSCVGGRRDEMGDVAVCAILGQVVEPLECPSCSGWSYGKTDCPNCKGWQHQSTDGAAEDESIDDTSEHLFFDPPSRHASPAPSSSSSSFVSLLSARSSQCL